MLREESAGRDGEPKVRRRVVQHQHRVPAVVRADHLLQVHHVRVPRERVQVDHLCVGFSLCLMISVSQRQLEKGRTAGAIERSLSLSLSNARDEALRANTPTRARPKGGEPLLRDVADTHTRARRRVAVTSR